MAKKNVTPEHIEEMNDTITDVKLEQLIPNVIDDFIVTIFEQHHTISLPDHITGTQFKSWHQGRGGVFSKDVLKYTFKKTHGKYVLIQGKDVNCVARLISEEEQEQFAELKLIDGKIKDRPYMILKKMQNGEKLTSTQRYINENGMEHEESIYIVPSAIERQDDDFEHHVGSISLFNE